MTYHQLTQEERYCITALLISGHCRADIARSLARDPSTISRELRRNATHHDGKYRAEKAHSYAVARRRRRARFSATDMATVARLIRRKWSAEQIAGVLRKRGTLRISHETIYRRIRWDKCAGGDLWRHTRIMSKFGRTLVERQTGYAIIKKLSARKKKQVTRAAMRAIQRHWRHFKPLTLDNGTEFHDYALLEQRFPLRVYFATPYHSWERGSNENFSGLLRQYLPKGVCMRAVTQAQCNQIADDLNNRPRKRLGFDTPAALYHRN